MIVTHKEIPTYDFQKDEWSYTSFSNQNEFRDYLDSIFKEPGEYEFDECSLLWNAQAKRYDDKGLYCDYPYMSTEYIEYWKKEKEKCRRGVIWKNGDKSWYTERAYYMFLNFMPLMNKEKGNTESFADVRDLQYHLALYEKRAELHNKHALVTKKRQCASSYYHTAKMLNIYWFEKKAILRNLASDETYLTGDKGIWNYYNGYRDFLNEFTAWVRPNNPNKDLSWIQRIEIDNNGIKSFRGRKSVMTGVTLKKSATSGVGGPSYYNYHEEAGIAPKMDKTYIYMKPALSSGVTGTTGLFIAAGSVGDLKDCKPLKKYMEFPEENGFLAVDNRFAKKNGVVKRTGLYIPEQWGMPGFIDQYGNSDVQGALEYLNVEYARMEKEMAPEDYQLELSQRPRYLDEAFANREISKFPVVKIEKRQSDLGDNPDKAGRKVKLSEDEKGEIKIDFIDKEDIAYPVNPQWKDKEGVCIIHKMPEANPQLFTYYGGVDNIETGETETSKSLFSIYIVEGATDVEYWDENGNKKLRIEGNKIVASYTGRYSDLDDTNRQGEYLIRLYNAFTLCEKNKPNFITHMIKQGYKHMLATAGDVPIFKEAAEVIDPSKNLEIGVYMDSTGKKQGIADGFLIQWLKQEIDAVYEKDEHGNQTSKKIKTFTVLDYIEDFWLLEELKNENDNTDRRDALRLAIMLMIIQGATGRRSRRVDYSTKPKSDQPRRKISHSINFLGENNNINYNNNGSNRRVNKPVNYLG